MIAVGIECYAKIENAQLAVFILMQVGRLDIAVHDIEASATPQTFAHTLMPMLPHS